MNEIHSLETAAFVLICVTNGSWFDRNFGKVHFFLLIFPFLNFYFFFSFRCKMQHSKYVSDVLLLDLRDLRHIFRIQRNLTHISLFESLWLTLMLLKKLRAPNRNTTFKNIFHLLLQELWDFVEEISEITLQLEIERFVPLLPNHRLERAINVWNRTDLLFGGMGI